MKILLLHPEDNLPISARAQTFDLVVDLGLAPPRTYEEWSRDAGCPIVSLSSYGHGFNDLYHLREIVQFGVGSVVDQIGIDWWSVVLPMLLPDLETGVMLARLAEELGPACELYCSRSNACIRVLQKLLGVPCLPLEKSPSEFSLRLRHYRDVFSRFDLDQIGQIARDKFDPEHALRRRLARKVSSDGRPVVLLPTAYINVSRTEVAYAAMLPEERFLLAVARPGGRMSSLPTNVQMVSLDAYFGPTNKEELASLLEGWRSLQQRLVSSCTEFRVTETLGVFEQVPGLMRWGLAGRDAWRRLFATENIKACLSADDANPYTGLPVLLAAQRGLPAVSVHHGALDYRMAVRRPHASVFLAKGELEHDYLVGKCNLPPDRIAMGSPERVAPHIESREEKPWLVFFTEPYLGSGWRQDEIYRDLLPALGTLARSCGLKVVFKLHPFESIKGHLHLLRKFMSSERVDEMQVLAGPISEELWMKARFALTFMSTTALDCAARGIPIFLCGWMQTPYGGYLPQYEKFGVGHILASPSQLQDVPQLLAKWKNTHSGSNRIWHSMEPQLLRALLHGTYSHRHSWDVAGTKAAT